MVIKIWSWEGSTLEACCYCKVWRSIRGVWTRDTWGEFMEKEVIRTFFLDMLNFWLGIARVCFWHDLWCQCFSHKHLFLDLLTLSVDKNALVVGSLIGVVCEKVVAQSIEHYLLHCLVARILVLDHMFSLFGASWWGWRLWFRCLTIGKEDFIDTKVQESGRLFLCVYCGEYGKRGIVGFLKM